MDRPKRTPSKPAYLNDYIVEHSVKRAKPNKITKKSKDKQSDTLFKPKN